MQLDAPSPYPGAGAFWGVGQGRASSHTQITPLMPHISGTTRVLSLSQGLNPSVMSPVTFVWEGTELEIQEH